jgi:hypothetical protein
VNAETSDRCTGSLSAIPISTQIRRIPSDCALAGSGQESGNTAPAPPTSVMNSRRRIGPPVDVHWYTCLQQFAGMLTGPAAKKRPLCIGATDILIERQDITGVWSTSRIAAISPCSAAAAAIDDLSGTPSIATLMLWNNGSFWSRSVRRIGRRRPWCGCSNPSGCEERGRRQPLCHTKEILLCRFPLLTSKQ